MNQAMNTNVEKLQELFSLDELCAHLCAQKARLEAQRRAVLDAEQAIIACVGSKDEGSFTVKCDRYKVTTTQPITRTIDTALARDLMQKLPRDLAEGLITWKPSISAKVYKDIAAYNPLAYDDVSKAVVSKQGKVSVKVEDLDYGESA